MFRVLHPPLSLGIPLDGWLTARNEVCLSPDSNLEHNVSLKITGYFKDSDRLHCRSITLSESHCIILVKSHEGIYLQSNSLICKKYTQLNWISFKWVMGIYVYEEEDCVPLGLGFS